MILISPFFLFSVADLLLSKSQNATLINNNDLTSDDFVKYSQIQTKTLTTTTTDLPGWTWWSPVSFDKSENKNGKGDDRESVENDDGTEERLWEREDNTINDAPDSNVSETDQRGESVSNRDNREEGAKFDDPIKTVDNGWDTKEEANTGVYEADRHQDNVGDDKEELRDKYLELMTHNTKMVDILKKTLEMQAEMFRKLIKYIFP